MWIFLNFIGFSSETYKYLPPLDSKNEININQNSGAEIISVYGNYTNNHINSLYPNVNKVIKNRLNIFIQY